MKKAIDNSVPIIDFETAKLDINRRYVRVTGERPGGFVEFDYAVGEPEIFVELILHKNDFNEFCESNQVEVLTVDSGGSDSDKEWQWRLADATRIRFKQ